MRSGRVLKGLMRKGSVFFSKDDAEGVPYYYYFYFYYSLLANPDVDSASVRQGSFSKRIYRMVALGLNIEDDKEDFLMLLLPQQRR